MGLENGIEVEFSTEAPDWAIEFLEYGRYEVAYWRKCWGLRNDIINIVFCGLDEMYEYDISVEDMKEIVKLLKSYSKETWYNSIWEFEEMKNRLSYQAEVLETKVLPLMIEGKCKAKFYDSY